MGTMDKDRNGIPDFVDDMLEKIRPDRSKSVRASPLPGTSRTANNSPALSPEPSRTWMLVLLGGVLFVVCGIGAVGVWYLFLR